MVFDWTDLLKHSQLENPSPTVLLLKGTAEVLAQASLLEELAERCGQPASMNWLEHFLREPNSRGKMPYLVLVRKEAGGSAGLRVEDVKAAVLLFEYRILGFATGVFSTDDASGLRTLIAPVEERAEIAQTAVKALLRIGAQITLVTYDGGEQTGDGTAFASTADVLWTKRRRPMAKALELADTVEATLARLGKSTRFNLGYYRRRLVAKTNCTFVAEAGNDVSEQDLTDLSLHPDNAAEMADFRLRWQSSRTLQGGFLSGVRSGDGKWLSLIGGWRQGDTCVVQWQMNAGGYEKSSIGTVMRSYLLENEVRRGMRRLIFYSGTPHSIKNSFVQESATDLIVQRKSWRARGLRLVSMVFASSHWLTGPPNFLARALRRDELTWHESRLPEDAVESAGSSVGLD